MGVMSVTADKKRRTITIDAHIDEELRAEDVNASGLINRLLTEYFASGLTQEAALRVKLSDLQQQKERAASKKRLAQSEKDKVVDEIEVVKNELQNLDRTELDEIETVVTLLKADNEGITQEQLTESNNMIRHRAEKAGMTPQRFITEIEERL